MSSQLDSQAKTGTRSPRAGSNPIRRVLVVNAFVDDRRQYLPQPYKVPQSMAPQHLAGAFSRSLCRVRIHNEHHSGPLEDRALLAWPDMLVLTGLIASLDRMRQLTAYARTLHPGVVVVLGGPVARSLPNFARTFADCVCLGDVEEILEVIREVWGPEYAVEDGLPRYDLVRHLSFVGYPETSRNCNFRCRFCALTGEGGSYQRYGTGELERQLRAMGPKKLLCFIDNNFYGNDRQYFLDRLDLLTSLRRTGWVRHWTALVTQDFFLNQDNLERARKAGCVSLFSGIESFSDEELAHFDKKQNLAVPQLKSIRRCMDAGIMFHYGLMFDLHSRTLAAIRGEIDLILQAPGIPLPSFASLAIPIPGTPYFQESVAVGAFLPRVKLRDLDGFTLCTRPRDPVEQVVPFVRDLLTMKSYRGRMLGKTVRLMAHCRKKMTLFQQSLLMGNYLGLCFPAMLNTRQRWSRPLKRTFVSTTEPLDPQYQPAFRVESRYRNLFAPVMVTDADGSLSREFRLDYYDDGRRRSDAGDRGPVALRESVPELKTRSRRKFSAALAGTPA